jgi:S1-C subfamily serine protease
LPVDRISRRVIRIVLCLLVFTPAIASEPDELAHSVVRIVNYSQSGDWFTPWDVSRVTEASGTGFVIADGLVMTNAHVVSNTRRLLIYLYNDPEPLAAQVVHIAHDADLALIRPLDPNALKNVAPLEFDGLPGLRSTVFTMGYPVGGTQLSSTRGVVSRIEEQLYVHSGKDLHLTVQTDAAINPGNSGGPVIQGNKVVGVAFQANPDLQAVGYFIPMEVIQRFLRDVEDGQYDGYPDLGVETESLKNPAARAYEGMAATDRGVRVYFVRHGSSADGLLNVGDVILSLDGVRVANDGSVPDGDGRISFGLLVDRKQIGERVTLEILREGKKQRIEVPVRGYGGAARHGHAYDRRPHYFVYGGLVFVQLNRETMKTFGQKWYAEATPELLYEYLIRSRHEPEIETKERVVVLRRLKHPVNAEMAWYRNQAVERVNGKAVRSIAELIEAIEGNAADDHLIEFSNLRRIGVLDRRAADAAQQEILERYGIQEDRNP